MKNLLKYKFILFILLFVLILSPLSIASDIEASFSSEDGFPDEVSNGIINSDLYLYEIESDIVIKETVNGNVFAFTSNSVYISGSIDGDIFVYANNITIDETAVITGNLFSYSNTLTLNGMISDIYAFANNLIIGEDGYVDRSLIAASENTTINGMIARDVKLQATTLNFGTIGIIGGDLSYTSNEEFNNLENHVIGNISYNPVVANTSNINVSSVINSLAFALIYSLFVVLLIIKLAPNFTNKASTILKEKFIFTFTVGIISVIAFFIASILLLIVSLGYLIGVICAIWTLIILMLTIGSTVFSMCIAKFILNKIENTKNYMFVLISLAIIAILNLTTYIPFIGFILNFVSVISGFGILLIYIFPKKQSVTDVSNI